MNKSIAGLLSLVCCILHASASQAYRYDWNGADSAWSGYLVFDINSGLPHLTNLVDLLIQMPITNGTFRRDSVEMTDLTFHNSNILTPTNAGGGPSISFHNPGGIQSGFPVVEADIQGQIEYWLQGGSGIFPVRSGPGTFTGGFLVSPNVTNQPTTQSGYLGGSITFNVSATGQAPLKYQWRFNSADVVSGTNDNLVITNAQSAAAGTYTVVVSNIYGSVTSTVANLNLLGLPVFFQPGNGIANADGQVVLSVAGLTGQGPIVFEYSSNLMNWSSFYTNPSGFGTISISDFGASNFPSCFYRARTPSN
jgi:hypothetical protein